MPKLMETTLDLVSVKQDSEFELVKLAQEGNRAAFDQLFHRHKAFIYNVCYRILGSSEDAVDATQNAFIKAYRSIRSFRGQASFRSWICRIAINNCISMLRRERRRRTLDTTLEQHARHEPDNGRVWEAMLELIPEVRTVLVLFYFQGLSCEEIGDVLGCSYGAVRTRLHRARAAFKKKYEELMK